MSLQALCERSMRTGVASRRIGKGASSAGARQQLRPDAQRLVGRVADAEHPLVAAHRAHAAPHLVGQGLEAQAVIGLGQRAGDRLARPLRCLRLQEDVDGLLEAALQQVGVAVERDEAPALHAGLAGQVEAVDGVEEEQRPHALVEVVAGAAEGVQLGALGQQLGAATPTRQNASSERLRTAGSGEVMMVTSWPVTVPRWRMAQSVRSDQPACSSRSASSSTSCASTSSRSSPLSASASWAVSRPYLTPTS